jgi:hypothetical protein
MANVLGQKYACIPMNVRKPLCFSFTVTKTLAVTVDFASCLQLEKPLAMCLSLLFYLSTSNPPTNIGQNTPSKNPNGNPFQLKHIEHHLVGRTSQCKIEIKKLEEQCHVSLVSTFKKKTPSKI